MKLNTLVVLAASAALVLRAGAQGPDIREEVFEELCAKVQQQSDTVTETEVIEVIDKGKELGRIYTASLVIKNYMARQQEPTPQLLKKAIDIALMAGDGRTAVARSKTFLKTAAPGPEASDIAATLYRVQIDLIKMPDDAYRFMGGDGAKFRQSIAARKFDAWYLREAERRRDHAAMARRLVLVFSGNIPLEQERLFYWEKLDWLIKEMASPSQAKYAAVPQCRRLVPLIRGDERRKQRLAFYTANMAFEAGTAGKDQETLDREFGEIVLAAATAYVTAFPDTNTMGNIITVFAEGDPNRGWAEANQREAKRAFFVSTFEKLSDKVREGVMAWRYRPWNAPIPTYVATPDQWAAMGGKHPALFKRSKATPRLTFVEKTDNPVVYSQQAAFLRGVRSDDAAIINSLAANPDLNACVDYLMRQESHYFANLGDAYKYLERMWAAYKALPRDEQQKLPADYYDKMMVRFGVQYVSKTPLALDTATAKAYMLSAWRSSGAEVNDKSKVAGHLASLAWVPYTAEQRKAVYDAAYREFTSWTGRMRSEHGTMKGSSDTAAAALKKASEAATAARKALEETRGQLEQVKKELSATNKSLGQARQELAQVNQQVQQARAAKAAADANNKTLIDQLTAKLNTLNTKAQQLTTKTKQLPDKAKTLGAKVQELSTQVEQGTAKVKQLAEAAAKQKAETNTAGSRAAKHEAWVAQVSPLEEAFKKALSETSYDATKAPNQLCAKTGEALAAARAKNRDGYLAAARAIYPQVKGYSTSKAPLGRSIMSFALRAGAAMDVVDFQCEALTDQLSRYKPQGDNFEIVSALNAVMTSRSGWRWASIPAKDKAMALKIHAVLAKALSSQLDKGQLPKELYDWARSADRGSGWSAYNVNRDLMARLMREKRLPVSDLMYQTYHYYGLPEGMSRETAFDDYFVEEARATKKMTPQYWALGGKDKGNKVKNTAAQIISGFAALPFGYGDTRPVYSRGEFWSWQGNAMNADAAALTAMLEKMDGYFGQTRFDAAAMGQLHFSYLLKDISQPGKRKQFFAKLDEYLGRLAQMPDRGAMPYIYALRSIKDPKELTDSEIAVLARLFSTKVSPSRWPGGYYLEHAATLLHQALVAKERETDLFALVPHFWKLARDAGDATYQRKLAEFAGEIMDAGHYDLAVVHAKTGLNLMGAGMGEDLRTSLTVTHSRSVSNVGGVIPVRREDPRYPLFAAQADFFSGNIQRSWRHYQEGREILLDYFRELDPSFCTWLIDRNVEVEEFETAEEIAREMIQWMESETVRFSPDVRLEVLLSYANIAFHRPDYPRARALYERIVAVKEFSDLRGKTDAEIRIAEVDRRSGEPDEAVKRLEKLLENKDHYVQTEGFFHLALVKVDLEEYLEAKDDLARVFALDPTHVEGKILEGKVNLLIRHLEESTDIQLGFSAKQRYLVPGTLLKVSVEDKTLSFVGRASVIEIRAWTDSGDEEFFNLVPFADSRTRFKGEIATALAPAAKNDRVLQVLGKDRIYYDFSDDFKEKHRVTSYATHFLTVISESELYASSGRILSKKEIEQITLERMIRSRLGDIAGPQKTQALSQYRPGSQVKPGNMINLRVIDADRSHTAENDKLNIRATVSSGDVIESFTLGETETHSGVFEGAIPTEPAPAVAYATDSDEGTEPNFVISSGDYPAWVALPDNKRPKTFSVDLNDSIFPGKMKVTAGVPGRKLKDFLVQTSKNGQDFFAVGSWPEAYKSWDGSPVGELIRLSGGPSVLSAGSLLDLDKKIDVTHRLLKRTINIKTLSAKWGDDVFGAAEALRINWDSAHKETWYLVKFSAAFYVPTRQTRNFRLDGRNASKETMYFLTMDGEYGEVRDEETGQISTTEREFKGVLNKGVHRIDVYAISKRRTQPGFTVLCDSEEPPYMVPCPAEMFDTEAHPQIRREMYKKPATVVASEEGDTFDITFTAGTRARAVRLFMFDFETDAPAIDRIDLVAMDGEELLPTKIDLMSLKKNKILEIIPGDRISITYEDPTCVDKNNRVREAYLSATYANANLTPNMVVGFSGGQVPHPILAAMRRFKVGDTIDVTISDPDMDVSDELDTVAFSIRTTESEPVELKAMESGEHTGRFTCRVFPIEEEPQRDTELKIVEGDEIYMTYMDTENTAPGIPWPRNASVEQVWYQEPELRVYSVTSQPLPVVEGEEPLVKIIGAAEEHVTVTRTMIAQRPRSAEDPGESIPLVIGGPFIVELLWPTIAQSTASKTELYVQTSSGRRLHTAETEKEFDITVPGTLKLTSHLGTPGGSVQTPLGYRDCRVLGTRFAGDPLDDGRFAWTVPMALGPVPEKSFAVEDPDAVGRPTEAPVLYVKGKDKIHVGFKYTNDVGETKWITRDLFLDADPFMDVMDRQYQETIDGRYVGESVYFRAIDMMKDVSDNRDKITLKVTTTSGFDKDVELTETLTHSGIFKGLVKFIYGKKAEPKKPAEPVEGEEAEPAAPAWDAGEMPVRFGDEVKIAYVSGEGRDTLRHDVEIFKGADGDVIPFSKSFKDPEIAVRTQLFVAEAYFELAKKHRRLGRKDITKIEIEKGKKILQETLRDYPDTEAKAQGDYLLANLALEFGEETKDKAEQKRLYEEALSRFSEIVGTYRDSAYAPKSQYKKALTLEKMGDIDAACEEYVKLSYRWPENELIAETIARLGQYFFVKGKRMTAAEGITDPVEIEKSKLQAKIMFTTAAEVFGRLAQRFPDHKLAEKTTTLSAQCYMRAEKFDKAVKVFLEVIEKPGADKDVRSEAMYWCGDAYMKSESKNSLVNAYRMFKKLTWDYPASKWAKYARGRLVDESLAGAEENE